MKGVDAAQTIDFEPFNSGIVPPTLGFFGESRRI